jgi:hypothetical protein
VSAAGYAWEALDFIALALVIGVIVIVSLWKAEEEEIP